MCAALATDRSSSTGASRIASPGCISSDDSPSAGHTSCSPVNLGARHQSPAASMRVRTPGLCDWRWRVGALYGLVPGRLGDHRFLLLTHRGRRRRETASHTPRCDRLQAADAREHVLSARGERADWHRNVRANPAIEILQPASAKLLSSASSIPTSCMRACADSGCAIGRSLGS
jgi:hypothetical protein